MHKIHNLSVEYAEHMALNSVSTNIPVGCISALIGPNGAGKSTLLKAVAGIVPCCSGEISINGQRSDSKTRQQQVAYLPQDSSAGSSLTLLEVVLLGRLKSLGLSVAVQLIDEAEQALACFNLRHLQHRTLDAVSGGQRQLVYLAQAMFRNPQLMLLDEPTAALDLRNQLVVLEYVRHYVASHNIAAVIAMHDLALAAQYANYVLFLSGGQLQACGSATEVIQYERLRQHYGVEVEIGASQQGNMTITPIRPVGLV